MFCSHYRAHEWFFESVWNEECQFVGVLCPNYQMYRRGECSCEDMWSDGHAESTCAIMGYDAEYAFLQQGLSKYSPQGKWYLKTSNFVPETGMHCQFQYQVIIKLSRMSPPVQNGTFVLSIVAENAHPKSVQVITQEMLSPIDGLRAHYRVSKLVLRPRPLPLAHITAVYLSYQPNVEYQQLEVPGRPKPLWTASVSVPWVKLSPIQVVNNRPIFFCHLPHRLQDGQSNLLKLCPPAN